MTTTTAVKIFTGTFLLLALTFGHASAFWQGPAVHTVAPGFLDGFVRAGSVGGDGTYPTVYVDGVAAGQVGADGHFWVTTTPGKHTVALSHTFGLGESAEATVASGRVTKVVLEGEAHPTDPVPISAQGVHILSAVYGGFHPVFGDEMGSEDITAQMQAAVSGVGTHSVYAEGGSVYVDGQDITDGTDVASGTLKLLTIRYTQAGQTHTVLVYEDDTEAYGFLPVGGQMQATI
jgi:hypothetical protein